MTDRTFVIADPHFGHRGIIGPGSVRDLKVPEEFRGMDPVEFMNLYMVGAWNKVVGPDDTTMVLGDVAFNMTPEDLAEILSLLQGRKILLRGNHDRSRSHHYWTRAGFAASIDGPIVLNTVAVGRVILSHEPVQRPATLNVCGHLHMRNKGLGPKHICVSAERLGYVPVRLGELLRSKAVSKPLSQEEGRA